MTLHRVAPWFSVALVVLAAALWAANWSGLLRWSDALGGVALLGAGPIALVGTVLAITNLAHGKRPIWISIAGIVLGLAAMVYIGFQFLEFAAAAAFA
jgi:hypothetical protein